MITMPRTATTPPPRSDVDATAPTDDYAAPSTETALVPGDAPPSRRSAMVIAISLLIVAAVLRIGLVPRSGLWADELFSLAMATGHSLEHKADIADASKGD